MIQTLAAKSVHYLIAFGGAFLLTLVLTPFVREFNRRIGMVDKPDPRRINKVPIPRGGGLALFLGVILSYSVFTFCTGRPPIQADGIAPEVYWRLVAIACGVVALGYADDKWSLPPKAKLLGQLVAAALAWGWAGLGFCRLWPELPAWIDCLLTVFWITGAINAFNLIDGLDGLASGIALIATLGMAGTLFIVGNAQQTLFYFAFAGGLAGFLRYNYNPASVFLGDCGSMYTGCPMAVLPLVSQAPNSCLVSVGVPLLAMGVPIFDTSLAIVRRSIRHLLRRRDASAAGNDKVMTADSDHLHHRILRAVGLNQRKAAWTLYAITAAGVAFGLVAMSLQSRTAGLWLLAVAFGCTVIFKNMARIEIYDAGRLLNKIARDHSTRTRRRWAKVAVPLLLACDVALLTAVFLLLVLMEEVKDTGLNLRLGLMIRVFTTIVFLYLFKAYSTVWSRAMLSNFLRLLVACFFGALVSGAVVYFLPSIKTPDIVSFTAGYMMLSFIFLSALRVCRPVIRDIFYALDCTQLRGRKDVSRILVYGAGLRYRTFRRELVRTTSANERMIVGIIDDDILLRGQQIGGIRIEGTLLDAPEIINRLNVDAVVIACVVTPEWLEIVRKTLAPTGVKVTLFSLSETEV